MTSISRGLHYVFSSDGLSKYLQVRQATGEDDIDPKYQELIFDSLQKGRFLGVGLIACMSAIATSGLLSFLTYRMIYWNRYYKRPLAENQYVVLIYNLLLADVQQAVGFLICLVWVSAGKSQYHRTACYLQGWLIQTADAGSGLFVLAIAIHTAAVVIRGRQLPNRIFCGVIIALWCFILVLGFIPVGLYGKNVFLVTEAGWCWLSPEYEHERLWGHYFWIFLAEFGTIILYTIMFIYLRRRMKKNSAALHNQQESLRRLNRVVTYMVIYPLAYVMLSLPLAAGRMSVTRNIVPSKTYFAVSGAFMALSGLVDVTVYTITRRHLLLVSDSSMAYNSNSYQRKGSHVPGTTVSTTIAANDSYNGSRSKRSKFGSRFRTQESHQMVTIDSLGDRDGSTDDIVVKADKGTELMQHAVYQETTIEITHEPAGERSLESSPTVRPMRMQGQKKRNSGAFDS
ncbi:G protein-coupled glucose receptor regulating Gpa2-domain-containing protein [Talaromyces proteolyticus]|uniref:G protein-coupled glucose receptor regulating Gpa2-domain-containing protein n=1 Tax=Talaromyces proteolyticus TaxID=1131652 RepID=A0AAD4KZM0_9EURO|nr:G protein-coupled glucose receptor regulating Gpa2-domain-containing protein [Talaromyces proteolyticus]KAH8703972.1 G protein-coupled glucose receptor regulating Gpa2-domain-containing protein [Talaromyces proteolyticus]